MALTPYHMGPGILVKALLRGGFSLAVYAWTQAVMDVEPAVLILAGTAQHHGLTHTLAGATVLGAAAAVTGKYLFDAGSGLLPRRWRARSRMRWTIAFLSAFIGSYVHLAMDSFAHSDVRPWWPLSASNQLAGLVSRREYYAVLWLVTAIGAVWYVTVTVATALNSRKRRLQGSAKEQQSDTGS